MTYKGKPPVSDSVANPEQLLQFVLETAASHGASEADVLLVSGRSTEVRVRMGETEQVKQSASKGVGLRVLVGNRTATTSSSDLTRESLSGLIARTCESAQVTAVDPHAGLPDLDSYDGNARGDLDLYDEAVASLGVEEALDRARETEDISRQADDRITNSEGAEMTWGVHEIHLANSKGICHRRRSSSASLWTAPVATEDGAMERDYWFTSARHLEDLASCASVGAEAARRTLRRLGARKPGTCQVPVVFEAPVSSRLLGSLAGAINGGAIYRQASYLCGEVGNPVAASSVHVTDDPHVVRGPASKPFDGEGLTTRPLTVVDGGVLTTYLLDSYTGRKLGLASTRHASRGLGGSPSPSATNFWMAPGTQTLDQLIRDVDRGLLVTELFGFGVNTITGDYSQGAVGLWIEGGELTHAVSEFTLASTLPVMWTSIDGIADDLDRQRGVSAPSFRIKAMTVAGV